MSEEDVGARLARVCEAMREAELDGILAFAPGWRRENVRYLPARCSAARSRSPTCPPTAR